jgi:tRNA 5-methylaminomethyl-2-thiouridine biosynthesis bifunctional protein
MKHAYDAIIIGGGLAGCSAGYALAKRGLDCLLIEREPALAMQASGNRAGILTPGLTTQTDGRGQFLAESYRYSLALLATLEAEGSHLLHRCGVVQLANRNHPAEKLRKLRQSLAHWQITAEAVTGRELQGFCHPELPEEAEGLFFPESGWLRPSRLCEALVKSAGEKLTVMLHQEALACEYRSNRWHLRLSNPLSLSAHALVLANARDAVNLMPEAESSLRLQAKLQRIRGQVSHLPATEASRQLQTALCYDGYLTPVDEDGFHCLGATFERGVESLEPHLAGHAENLAKLARYLPETAADYAPETLAGRAQFRLTTPDRLPMVGPITLANDSTEGNPGRLYLSLAHGARGIATAPYAGERIAAHLVKDEAAPSPASVAVHPARYGL